MGRSGQRCQHCGAGVPDDAVYCPACGSATGQLRIEPVKSGDVAPATEVALGAPRRRWIGVGALAAAAAVVVGVLVVGGGGGGTSAPATTAPTTAAPTTTVAPSTSSTVPTPTTSTSVYSSMSAGRPLEAGADGVVVYVGVRDDELARVDLGAGTVDRRLVTAHGGGPWMALGRHSGVVIASSRGDQADVFGLADGPAAVPQQLATWEETGGGSTSPQAAPAAEPDEIWVWHEGGADGTVVRRMRLDGTVTAGPVALPRFATFVGPDGPGALMIGGPDGLYRATVDGQSLSVEHIWPRVPVVVTPTAFLDLACSESLDCHLAVVDRATGAFRPVPAPVEELFNGYSYAFTAPDVLSPDGRWLAHLEYSGHGHPRLVVYDLTDGNSVVDHAIIGSFYGGIRALPFSFSPDGKFLLFIDVTGQLGVWPVGSAEPPHDVLIPGVDSISSMSVLP